MRGLRILARAELAAALRGRWFSVYGATFLAAGLVVMLLGTTSEVIEGYRSSLRAIAAILHMMVLFVPMMALMPAVATVADDRESGILEYLLAQPAESRAIFLGKWVGTAGALALAIVIGLAPGLGAAVLRDSPPAAMVLLLALTLLLALGFVSLGILLAVVVDGRARATTFGIALWLILVVLGSLGLMTAFVRGGVPADLLVGWSLINPIEAFRLGMLCVLDPQLEVLGPVGVDLVTRVGVGGIVVSVLVSLTLWALVPAAIGVGVFGRRARRA